MSVNIDKRTLNASPFVGVFGILTDKIFLVPTTILEKELRGLADLTGAEVIKANIANSALLGVLGVGVKNKIALSDLALQKEVDALEKAGLKAKTIPGVTALGNLVTVTGKGGAASLVLSKAQVSEIESFFGINISRQRVAGSDIVGSSVVANSRGFIVHPQVSREEFDGLKQAFKTGGIPTSANYGDRFVGNSVLANSSSAIAGQNTTGHELIRIEEAFYG